MTRQQMELLVARAISGGIETSAEDIESAVDIVYKTHQLYAPMHRLFLEASLEGSREWEVSEAIMEVVVEVSNQALSQAQADMGAKPTVRGVPA